MKDTLTIILAIILIAGLSFLIGRKTAKQGQIETITERVDTLVIRDTITAYRPKYVTRRVIDSVLVPVHDTTKIRDTLYAYLVREQVTWEDSLARVYASGINPQVDSVLHFTSQMVITKETIIRKESHWGIGIQGGVGVGKGGVTPYVGVGVQYNILSW